MELHRHEVKDLLLQRGRLAARIADVVSGDANGTQDVAGELGGCAISIRRDGKAIAKGGGGMDVAVIVPAELRAHNTRHA